MPNIVDNAGLAKKFMDWLQVCRDNFDDLTEWEQRFVTTLGNKVTLNDDLRGFNSVAMWNPTSNQWNTLKLLAEKYE